MHPAPGWGAWSAHPSIIVLLLAAGVGYALLFRHARGRPGGDRAGVGHWLPFASGIVLLAIALLSPLDEIGDDYLLSAHMLQHILLADIAPPLLILGLRAPVLPLGLPRTGLRLLAHRGRLGRVWSALTRPWVALPLWVAVQWGWSVPAAFDFAAAHEGVHRVEHATLFFTGVLLWWLIVGPLPLQRRQPRIVRLWYLAASRAGAAAVCLPLTWLGTTFYPRYVAAPRAYGLSAIADQRLAGAGMCFIELLVFGIALMVVFIDALDRQERTDALAERAAGGIIQ